MIPHAVNGAKLELLAQRICAVSNLGETLYLECLARFAGRDGSIYQTDRFIAELEKSGKVANLDLCVVGKVLDRLAQDSCAILGCNVSAVSLGRKANWREIRAQVLERVDLAPRLVIELTETQSLESLASARDAIEELRLLGCRVALDDFGAGFASPSLGLSIDFDIVKIDKALLWDIRKGPGASDSLRHIVGLASCLAPVVVAEGVETDSQALYARAVGVTHIQGYYVSRPMALANVGSPMDACA